MMHADFTLTPLQEAQFAQLDGLYRDWNARINVISRKDIDQLYQHHVLHSLSIARYLALKEGALEHFSTASVLDLGTGGGFPGIPLAILFPQAHFVLCDSIGKKALVAREVATALQLQNVTVVNARAETLPQTFDYVVSRAVAALPELLGWVKGKFSRSLLCLKGGDINEEIAAAMAKFRLPKGSVHSWKVASWLDDPWYEEKWVIEVEKNL